MSNNFKMRPEWEIAILNAVNYDFASATSSHRPLSAKLGERDLLEAQATLEDNVVKGLSIKKGFNDDLKKGLAVTGTIGMQGPPSMDAASEYSPLILQSIDNMLADGTTYNEDDFVFFKQLPQGQATQTMHEWGRRDSYGDIFSDNSSAEGNIGNKDNEDFSRSFCQMKFWAPVGEITNVSAGMSSGVTLIKTSLLEEKTYQVLFTLKRELEIDSLFGDSNLNSLKIDGVCTQLETSNTAGSGCVKDLDGGTLTLETILLDVRDRSNVGTGAHPTDIYLTTDIYADFEAQAMADGARWDNQIQAGARRFVKGAAVDSFGIVGDNSKKIITFHKVPFLDQQKVYGKQLFKKDGTTLISANGKAPPVLPVFSSISAAGTTSKFGTADVGAYYYYLMAVNAGGHSAPVVTTAQAVAKGQAVTILFDVPADPKPLYYHVFRSAKDGATTTAKWIGKFKYNTAGAGGKVSFVDSNQERPGTGRVLVLNMQGGEQGEIKFYKFLPMARVPLAATELRNPFTVFFSGGLQVLVPEKQLMYKNVAMSRSITP